jgi:hypothetical protein
MAAAEEGDEEFFHDLGLADDDFSEFGFEGGVGVLEFLDGGEFVGGHLDGVGGGGGLGHEVGPFREAARCAGPPA